MTTKGFEQSAETILLRVLGEMAAADEIGGPSLAEYVGLMQTIAITAAARSERAKRIEQSLLAPESAVAAVLAQVEDLDDIDQRAVLVAALATFEGR